MISSAITIEEISKKLKPLFGDRIDALYFRYSASESMQEKNEIAQVLRSLYQKNLAQLLDQGVLIEPPERWAVEGEYPLATVSYARKKLFPFALRETDWPRHVCITGMSGSGKTNFALNILLNFIEKDKPFLVFDWKKSFRPLVSVDPSLMCFTIGKDEVSNLFKMNINIPPKGVSPREWINVLCDLLTESFMVSFGVHKILLETLDECFAGWGVYEGGKHYPNWMHIKKMLEQKARDSKGRETGWYESALRIASVLTFGDFGKVINYDGRKSLSIEDLFDKRVILELNSLGNTEKKFFCEYLLTYIYKLKKSGQNKSDSKFNYAILVDEAHNIFLKNKTYFVAESVTDMVYREMREYGISLICLDQHCSKLSDTVKGNSACTVAFQQQLPQDIMDVSALMQLDHKKDMFAQLPVGTAIVKLSERYTRPFLIEAPLIDLRKTEISDEKISSRMQCFIQGFDVEKNDPEFKAQLIAEPTVIEEATEQEAQEIIVQEYPRRNYITSLSFENTESPKEVSKQEVLFNFIIKKLAEGKSLYEAERLLERGLDEGLYTFTDVLSVINKAMEAKLTTKKAEVAVQESVLETRMLPSGLSNDQEKFIKYLQANSGHEKSTVEVYKAMGFSPRKGNKIKEELMQKGMLRTEEVKYEKGWKKFIRLA